MTKMEEILIKAGYKITAPRLAVLKHLSTMHEPISARDLHRKIKIGDQASVYRTLKLFEELRIVNAEIVEKEKHYCLADKPHHHIVCRKCEHTESVACDHRFQQLKNFTDIHHQLTLNGICNQCNP